MSRHLQPLSNRMEAARGSSLASIKTQQLAREEEGKVRLKRAKGTIVLVEQFLLDQGYTQSLQALQRESGIGLTEYSPADNIDLLSMVSEFEQYYELKFSRRPRLFRSRGGDGEEPVKVITEGGEKVLVRRGNRGAGATASSSPSTTTLQTISKHSHYAAHDEGGDGSNGVGPSSSSGVPTGRVAQLRPAGLARANQRKSSGEEFELAGQRITATAGAQMTTPGDVEGNTDADFYGRALKPLPVFPTSELNDLAGTIMRDILDTNPSVRWSDIAELDEVKHLLKEAVVMPVKYPEMFEDIVRPWKGILLFGPPGTGKTLLAKAIATECRTTFFNISASTVVSKWRGDSEKLVRMLFDLAFHYAPSTIFIDEIDSIMSARSSEGEHEGSRRMKTELLTQMDGLLKRKGGGVVFVLAASNVPWDLDAAMLRRLEKRILVTLPTPQARTAIMRRLLARHVEVVDMDWAACAELTEGMSGADIDVVCREAMMRPIRTVIAQLEACGSDPLEVARLKGRGKLSVTLEDVRASLAVTHSSVHESQLGKYQEWSDKFGSGMSV